MRMLCSALLLVGCQQQASTPTPNIETTLDKLPGLTLEVATVALPDASTNMTIKASYEWQDYLGQQGGCATLSSDTVAMFDQTPVPLAAAGTEDDEGECLTPLFETELILGTAGAHHVTLPDNIAMDFADGQLVARSAIPTSGVWTLVAGQNFTVTWSTPSDLATQTPSDIDALFLPTNADFSVQLTGTAIGSDTFTVAVPAAPLGTGDGVIDFDLGRATGSATSCSGATQCTWSADAAYWHAATL